MKNKNVEKTEKDIVESVLDDFKYRQFERKNFENIWQLNINFFLGNQYCYITPAGDIMDTDKQYFWQEREVYNHIANLVELRQAKLSRVRPTLTVVPFSDDDNDIAIARTSKKILKAASSRLNMVGILTRGTMWSEICGTVFYKVDWNNDIGNIIGVDDVGNKIKEGDVEVTVVSPFEIYPDSNTYNSVDECESIIYARTFHREQVKNIWGIDVEGRDIDVFTLDALGTSGGLGYASASSSMSKKMKKDQVLVLEKYEKPSIEYPNGRLIIVVGDQLVYMGDLPYINKNEGLRGFPFIRQTSIPSPNCFWGTSIIERCIPIQRSYNAIKNRKHEFLNRLTMGILSVEDGSLDVENLEEEGLSPGKVLIHRQGSQAPQLLSTGNVPIDFQYEENSLLNEFINISGVSDLLKNSAINYGNLSGIALQLLIEQDEARLTSSAEEIKNSAKEIAKHILRLYKQYALTAHTTRIVGENGDVEMFYWNGNQINSEDIVFETDNELNETIAQKRSMIFEILKTGLLHDENGKLSNTVRSKLLEQLGLGIWETRQDMSSLQRAQAERENLELITTGKMHDPMEIDNHDIHIDKHTEFMLSNQFEKANQDGKLTNAILKHIREHKKYRNVTKMIEEE